MEEAKSVVDSVSEMGDLVDDVKQIVQDGKSHKFKDMAHRIIDILSKVIPKIKSIISRKKSTTVDMEDASDVATTVDTSDVSTRDISTRDISNLSNKQAILLSVVAKLLSLRPLGTRDIMDHVSLVEEAINEHVFERDISTSDMCIDDAVVEILGVLDVENEDVHGMLVCLRSDLEDDSEDDVQ